jgi:hypothetical protein
MKKHPSVERLYELFIPDFDAGTITWKGVSNYHSRLNGKSAGTKWETRGKFYVSVSIDKQRFKRSRIMFAMKHMRWPSLQIDHIDGNGMNDEITNLREATATQNAWNHKGRTKKSDLPMGVRRNANGGKYSARISVNKKMISLGSYDTPEEAKRVYIAKRKEYYGAFA